MLIVKPQNIHGVFGGEEFRIQYANGDCVGYVMIVFLAKIISGELCPDGNEIRQVEFMSLDSIRGLNTAKWVKTVLSEFTNHVYLNQFRFLKYSFALTFSESLAITLLKIDLACCVSPSSR